jgi:hypothetical protein
MSNPVTVARRLLVFAGAALIVNPPIVGGRTVAPAPDAGGNIAYTFTQPAQPCGAPACEQEILRIDINPDSCWIYEDIRLDNVEAVPEFFYKPILTSEALRVSSLGNVNGHVFVFRAHVTSRCAPSS